MSEAKDTKEIPDQPSAISWQDFLQEEPPGSAISVTGASKSKLQYGATFYDLVAPELQLHCPEPTCNTLMFFTSKDGGDSLSADSWRKTYLTYWCRNCRKYSKMFSVAVRLRDDNYCEAYKFGELPQFGPPLPARVLRLIQPDRELFLSGRRCENQGLGIGAFTYYRRVVENQWTRLVDEIIKVAKTVGTQKDILDRLEISRDEKQFSKAVKNLTDAIPPVLLINGQNPLVLLHGALSQGVHNLPDEECLNLAMSIRVVLVELAEKLGQALKDEKELAEAITRLLRAQSTKKPKDESAKE